MALEWRCRRGMKELDILLMNYLKKQSPSPEETGTAVWEKLLNEPDPSLWAFLIGNEVPKDPSLAELVQKIRAASASDP